MSEPSKFLKTLILDIVESGSSVKVPMAFACVVEDVAERSVAGTRKATS